MSGSILEVRQALTLQPLGRRALVGAVVSIEFGICVIIAAKKQKTFGLKSLPSLLFLTTFQLISSISVLIGQKLVFHQQKQNMFPTVRYACRQNNLGIFHTLQSTVWLRFYCGSPDQQLIKKKLLFFF